MKRLLLLICTLLCANVLFAQTRFWVDSLQYEVTSMNPIKVIIYDANPTITTANIPTTVSYNGATCSVTSIGDNAFQDCSSLTSVNIGESVTSIGERAFQSCSSLTSIDIPNSVTSIGERAFQFCSSLTSINIPNTVNSIGEYTFYNCSSLTSVNIPNSVTSIGESAFSSCSSLTSVSIPNSVTSIGESAFSSCSSLTSITIPNSVTSIGGGTFFGCSSLTSVDIPNSVTSIGGYAFYGCSSLTSVDIPNSVTSIGGGTFSGCSSLTSVDIPNSVTSIGDGTFFGCSSLTSVDIPNSVTSIGDNAFGDCSSLISIDIPNSVTSIEWWAFSNCSSLISIDIPNGVDSIGHNMFKNCSSLISVTIGNSVTYIGLSAFYGCSSLTSVTCLAINPPTFENDCFNETPLAKTLYVRCGRVETYFNHYDWGSEFFPILEVPFELEVNEEVNGSVYIERNSCSSSTLTATANDCYQFVSWNDGNTENPRIVSLTSDTAFTATFEEIESNTELFATICEGQVYNENGFNVSEAGVYTQTHTSVNGCNSIVTLTLNVNPIFNTELSATICEGQVYTENNFNISEAGVYTQTLTSVNGCDSIVTLTLNVNLIYNTELSATICEGQVYTENNFNVSEAGVYTQTLTSVNGCDSIVTLTVSVNPTFDTTINATINTGETYAEFGFNESEAGTYVQNLQSINGCDSTITLVLSVNSSLLDIEETEISLYPNPTKSEITFSQAIEKVEVIDLTGKAILTFSNAKTINIESLPAGAYYLRLTNEEKTSLQKVIKQ